MTFIKMGFYGKIVLRLLKLEVIFLSLLNVKIGSSPLYCNVECLKKDNF